MNLTDIRDQVTIKATEQICGSFTNFEPRGNLTDSVAAFFTFPEFVTEDERIFLILALLVSEYKRRLKPVSVSFPVTLEFHHRTIVCSRNRRVANFDRLFYSLHSLSFGLGF